MWPNVSIQYNPIYNNKKGYFYASTIGKLKINHIHKTYQLSDLYNAIMFIFPIFFFNLTICIYLKKPHCKWYVLFVKQFVITNYFR